MKKITAITIVGLVVIFAIIAYNYMVGGYNNAENNTEDYKITEDYIGAQAAVDELKGVLKNPSSLQVNSITYVINDGSYNPGPVDSSDDYAVKMDEELSNFKYIYKMDVSAENGFGGTNREIYYVQYRETGNLVWYYPGDSWYMSIEGRYENFTFSNEQQIDLSKLSY